MYGGDTNKLHANIRGRTIQTPSGPSGRDPGRMMLQRATAGSGSGVECMGLPLLIRKNLWLPTPREPSKRSVVIVTNIVYLERVRGEIFTMRLQFRVTVEEV